MPATILITGATGFIGRQLTRDLITAGYNVRVLVRDERKARKLFGKNVETSLGDLDNAVSVTRACHKVEVVYHIAGIYRFGLRHHRELWRINVRAPKTFFAVPHPPGSGKWCI
jgi:dihydroflavonol-4-reductase